MIDSKKLIEKAIEARNNSYSPYSKFKVGAALLTKDGTIYPGANIESTSFGLTLCAERNAIFGAYARGVKKEDILGIAVVAETPGPCSPCGACRQIMVDLMPKDAKIYLSNLKGNVLETTVEEILPYAFEDSDMKKYD